MDIVEAVAILAFLVIATIVFLVVAIYILRRSPEEDRRAEAMKKLGDVHKKIREQNPELVKKLQQEREEQTELSPDEMQNTIREDTGKDARKSADTLRRMLDK